MIKWDLSQKCKNGSTRKSINEIHHINRIKEKINMSVDTERTFGKMQQR